LSAVLLSGQSNAGGVSPFLVSAYRPSEVFLSAHGGEPIRKWAPGTLYWNELARLLRQPLKAFVWWQGESDLESTTYLADLADLVARVRAANHAPALLVIVVRILPQPHGWGAGVRAAQEAFVLADANAVLVSSDGVPAQADGIHLMDAGYRQVADRIVAVLRKQ
jgi:lysophospholipase L1-like esterase